MKMMNSEKLNIIQAADLNELSQKALEFFVNFVRASLRWQDKFYLAVSGGKTPHHFYQLLETDKQSLELPWHRIELFWVDERCVPPDSPDSNYKLAADTFLKTVPVPLQNIHRIHGEYSDYLKAVREYDETLRKVFNLQQGKRPVFDLMILGMGADGHIASLLPDSYAIFDTEDLVTQVYRFGEGHNRITLTHPVICNSRQLLVLVSGREKAEIVRDVFLNEPDEVQYPVHTLWPILDKVVWLIDNDAAKYL